MIELIRKVKFNRKYAKQATEGLSWIINKGSKMKPCVDCGALISHKNSPKVAFCCSCNCEPKDYNYIGERGCGIVATCPECKKQITLCC